MAKSKKHAKRRGKVKAGPRNSQRREEKSWDGKGGYSKTDGQGNVCYYDRNHNLKNIDPATPPEDEIYSLDTIWTIGTVVAGMTVKEVIEWRHQYVTYWIKQGIKLDPDAFGLSA